MHHPPASTVSNNQQWLEIGHIVGPHGLQGEVKVFPDSDFPERFEQPGQRWLLRPGSADPEEIELRHGRYLSKKRLYVVQLAGVTYRDQAEALRGATIMVPISDRPPLASGEFHLLDLVGLTVIDHHKQEIVGTVISIANAGNDLLEIQLKHHPTTTALIPFVKEIVTTVDLQNRQIQIEPPAGLLP